MTEEQKAILKKLSAEFNIPYIVIATITMNESNCDPDVKPYKETTWTYFTSAKGKALGLHGSMRDIQAKALELLGEEEYTFQVHAWGCFQCTGSVLRELGYKGMGSPSGLYEQGKYAMKHLSKMRDRFVSRYQKEPTHEQFYALYNGGMGAVTENGYEQYVAGYIAKAIKNRKYV